MFVFFPFPLLQELLYTLLAMDQSTDRSVRESSKVIKSNVFYVPEYRETILSQLLCFDELKMSRFVLKKFFVNVNCCNVIERWKNFDNLDELFFIELFYKSYKLQL